ncbi:preprotein translocase subunit SecG [Hyphomicrobium sp.]|uniref:preprotein translocase subunit SecG n=1 Tax=Hyphomicrobium sp. TaxID=82 RepID=UPI002E2FF9D7|nr:preprotein translocase subunit SecG [Hyphomicrobium sp.]HEX2842401.1 preprotein translocase subunit SecG [Hyphomicrobium sp.]
MTTVLLVIHIMVAAALVAVVLWQRSEGGALGIGGGGGGFLTGRGTANLLTRTTAILAACFFLTSILLTLISQHSAPKGSAFDAPASAPATTSAPETPGAQPTAPADNAPRGGILDKLK